MSHPVCERKFCQSIEKFDPIEQHKLKRSWYWYASKIRNLCFPVHHVDPSSAWRMENVAHTQEKLYFRFLDEDWENTVKLALISCTYLCTQNTISQFNCVV